MSEERPNGPPPMPLWVKAFGIVAIAVMLAFAVLLVVGGGHGPGRHTAPPAVSATVER